MQLRNNSADATDTDTGVARGSETINTDICIIGAGSGGLSVAAAAAAFGRKVVLIEKHKMGGDCLNYGCVPSKAMIAAGKRAHIMRTSGAFGIAPHRAGDRLRQGPRPRQRRDRRHRAERLRRALHRPRRSRHPGRRAVHRQIDGAGR